MLSSLMDGTALRMGIEYVGCGTIGTLDAGVGNVADVATSLFDAEVTIDLVRM